MEITVTSRESIKPASPTPDHMNRMKLSLIDQYMHPAYFARMILFYSAQGDPNRFQTTNMSHRLKKSLSEVLTEFYPLAGTFNNNQTIECDDNGLAYVEARVKGPLTLEQFLACPKAEELDPLLPYDVLNYGTGFKGLSAVQVTVFDACGGMTVGISLSHLLADAASLGIFINKWAAAMAHEGDTGMPNKIAASNSDFASLFPPRDIPVQNYDDIEVPRKLITKSFSFSQQKINTLKGKFAYERPTRVEVVSALFLKCLLNLSNISRSAKSIFTTFAINLRSRMSPPLPMDSFGNMLLPLMRQIDPDSSLNGLGVQLRALIREIDSDYMGKLQANDALLLSQRFEEWTKLRMDNDVRFLDLSSWCNFGFYQVDLGWGAPTWVAPVYLSFPDSIILLNAKNDDGFEVWVTLDRDDMAQFESQDEFLEFACPNPMVCEPK